MTYANIELVTGTLVYYIMCGKQDYFLFEKNEIRNS